MAEQEATHRRTIETGTLTANINEAKAARKERRIGQVLGFFIGIVAISASVYASTHNAEWTGRILGGGTVAGLVAVFVLGRRQGTNDQASGD